MRFTKIKNIQKTALLFIIIAPFSIIFYALYVFNPANIGNIYLYIFQVVADVIAIISVSTLWLTIILDIIQPEHYQREFKYSRSWLETAKPAVDILIPVTDEPVEMIRNTIEKCKSISYPHTVYVLDDKDLPTTELLADEMGVRYIARPADQKQYAKAGNINHALRYCSNEFFAVFDADQAPVKSFLDDLLPFFENSRIALLQTPQYFDNKNNFIAAGTAQAQDVFYKYIQPAKNSYNAAFCVGTNVIYRRSAIDAIGGIAKIDHSEDIWTSVYLHEKGYETVFYNNVLAYGKAPDTVHAFFNQQKRWAMGAYSLFFTHNPLFLKSLTLDQKLQYFFTNVHYFGAISVFIYLMLPIIYLLFNIHPMNLSNGSSWLVHYIPYFATVYFIPLLLLGNVKLSTMSTSIASFFPHLQALISSLSKPRELKWIATQSETEKQPMILKEIWPHTLILLLSFAALIIGWINPEKIGTTFVTSLWVCLNAYFIWSFIKFGVFADRI